MLKQINKLLKLVGFNLVRAKRRKGNRLERYTPDYPIPKDAFEFPGSKNTFIGPEAKAQVVDDPNIDEQPK